MIAARPGSVSGALDERVSHPCPACPAGLWRAGTQRGVRKHFVVSLTCVMVNENAPVWSAPRFCVNGWGTRPGMTFGVDLGWIAFLWWIYCLFIDLGWIYDICRVDLWHF